LNIRATCIQYSVK